MTTIRFRVSECAAILRGRNLDGPGPYAFVDVDVSALPLEQRALLAARLELAVEGHYATTEISIAGADHDAVVEALDQILATERGAP